MSSRISLQRRIDDYLAERRRLGFELHSRDTLLASFARYVASQHHRGPLTVELIAAWARCDKGNRGTPGTWARRLALLRHFARYLKQFEPDTEIPEELLFGPEPGRVAPHIFHEDEIIELLAAAGQLKPQGSIRPVTYETLFGLMAATGVRVSEAIHLRDADVDLKHGMLTIRQTKFAKSRQLPIHPSTVAALARYRRQRARHVATTADMPFLISSRGRRLGQPLGDRQAHRVFNTLRDGLGLVNRGAHAAPRLHDLRHNSRTRIIPHTDLRGLKSPGENTRLMPPPMRNNQRLFKKASRRSSGRKRGARTSMVAVLAKPSVAIKSTQILWQ